MDFEVFFFSIRNDSIRIQILFMKKFWFSFSHMKKISDLILLILRHIFFHILLSLKPWSVLDLVKCVISSELVTIRSILLQKMAEYLL